MTLLFAAVAYIPMADATAISFLNPVFGMMLATPLLHAHVGRVRWFAALLALGAGMVMDLELIFIKKLAGREKLFQIPLVNDMIGLGIAMIAVLRPPTASQEALPEGIGLCMAVAQTCFVNAMARADASLVAPFSHATLIFAATCDALRYGVVSEVSHIRGPDHFDGAL